VCSVDQPNLMDTPPCSGLTSPSIADSQVYKELIQSFRFGIKALKSCRDLTKLSNYSNISHARDYLESFDNIVILSALQSLNTLLVTAGWLGGSVRNGSTPVKCWVRGQNIVYCAVTKSANYLLEKDNSILLHLVLGKEIIL